MNEAIDGWHLKGTVAQERQGTKRAETIKLISLSDRRRVLDTISKDYVSISEAMLG